jgi:hypothetical protein
MLIRLWHRLLCSISDCVVTFFHKVEIVETYDSATRKLRCVYCDKYFAMSDRHRAILPWDEDFEKITCATYKITRTKK